MKSLVVLSALIAIAVAVPHHRHGGYGGYEGGYGDYGLEGYGDYYSHHRHGYPSYGGYSGLEGGYGVNFGLDLYGGQQGYGSYDGYGSGYEGSYRKKRSVVFVPSTYSSIVAPSTVYSPHTLVKSAVVSPVYYGGVPVVHPLYDTRSVFLPPYYTHQPAVVGLSSPTLVTDNLLIKKKRETK